MTGQVMPAAEFSDDALLGAVRGSAIKAGSLTHREHLRLGWTALCDHDLPEAMGAVKAAVKAFAGSLGKPEIYHETLTLGFLLILADRMSPTDARGSFASFLEDNADLLDWKPLLRGYWSDELLWSDRARTHFVMPDAGNAGF